MGLQKIDKKQLPQVIGLGAASVGMFGYFAYKMLAPTVSAAPPPSAKTVETASATGAASAPAAGGAGTAPADTAAVPDAPPPTPGMRDPFIPTISDQDAPAGSAPAATPTHPMQVANNLGVKTDTLLVPSAPPLPAPSGRGNDAPPLPPIGGSAADIPTPDSVPVGRLAPMPAAPSWTVTGVLQGGGDQVAILRSGEVRQFAHRGDVVGGNFRVVDVTRNYVVLRHGAVRYTLPLGGPKTEAAKPRKAAQSGGAFAADAAALAPPSPTPDQAAPGQPPTQLQPALQAAVATPGDAPPAAAGPAQALLDKH